MCLQNLMNFHHCLFKILKKNQNITDGKMDGRTDGQRENSNTPPPPTNIVCGWVKIWWHDETPSPEIPSPYGWSVEASGEAFRSLNNTTGPRCNHSTCGCKISKCALSYSCKTHGLNCTELCECSADEETCTNTQEHYQTRIEDSDFNDDPSI